MLQKRKRSLIYLRKRGNQMKKKSLFDIAMEKKQNQTTENENIIILKKRSFIMTIFEIIGKILRLILYIILFILLTIGTTVLTNSTLREQLINIVKFNF